MSGYPVSQFILDIMQRAGRLDNASGITLMGALNSVQSLIGKKLLDRRSDLLADNKFTLSIPAQGYSCSLPDGFIAMAEKPRAEDIYTDWMMGTVVSYNSTTGSLVLAVTQANGSDTLADWNIASVPAPGGQSDVLTTSTTSLTVTSSGDITLTVDTGLTFPTGTPLYVLPQSMPTNPYPAPGRRTLQPTYLSDDEDDEHDIEWWSWYGLYGWEQFPPARHPHLYNVINTTLYVRPMAILPITIKGRYFGLPTRLTESSTIPWDGLFDEIFREGTIKILQKGISIPEMDPDFMGFLMREFDSVINTRMHLLPKSRTRHSSFM